MVSGPVGELLIEFKPQKGNDPLAALNAIDACREEIIFVLKDIHEFWDLWRKNYLADLRKVGEIEEADRLSRLKSVPMRHRGAVQSVHGRTKNLIRKKEAMTNLSSPPKS